MITFYSSKTVLLSHSTSSSNKTSITASKEKLKEESKNFPETERENNQWKEHFFVEENSETFLPFNEGTSLFVNI